MATDPIILLSSGDTFKLHSVLLYDEQKLRRIEGLRAQAMANAGPASSGIGFIGSPGWVLGGVAVMSVIEGMATRNNQKQAFLDLQQAEQISQSLVDSAVLCDFADIHNAHLPHPELWRFEKISSTEINILALPWSSQNSTMKRYGKTKSDITDGKITVQTTAYYVHNGNDFLQVVSDVGPLNIRWSSVVAFRCDKTAAAKSTQSVTSNPFR